MIEKLSIKLLAICVLAVVTLIAYSSYYMNGESQEKIVELKSKETIKVGDLTISHVGGGHKILMPKPNGEGGGDLSIVNISMFTPRATPIEKRFYNESEKESFEFDNYTISLIDMENDGKSVRLKITKNEVNSNSNKMSNLTLYIGVRYFGGDGGVGPFDMVISIDGKEVANGNYPTTLTTRKPDQINIPLMAGQHTLHVKSNRAEPHEFTTTFTMEDREQFAQINYDYYPKDHVNYEKRGFNFEIQSDDFGWR